MYSRCAVLYVAFRWLEVAVYARRKGGLRYGFSDIHVFEEMIPKCNLYSRSGNRDV